MIRAGTVPGVPHGVLHVAWLERPVALERRRDVIAHEDADLARENVNPDVVLVDVGRDKGLGHKRLLENSHHAVRVLRTNVQSPRTHPEDA